ncbi:MAG: adaptor complexes medium subunit family protein [Nitrosotalea sp.]
MKITLLSIFICTLILTNTFVYGSIPSSPLGQFKSGISAQDVRCHENFILVIKLHDGSPSCIKPTSTRLLKQDYWVLVQHNNTSSKGLLTGYITYYPCRPVERPTDPPCTGNAHNYTVSVYQIDNKTIAGQTTSNINGVYKIELESGEYIILTPQSMAFHDGMKMNLIKIGENKTTIFNIDIDSGIR